ncbi:Conidial yellow pigment biosynthesis polyketide synthase [Trichoderma lentiforme]|uniref:Conidial yellow pigment biosynthesis polyketide synthase n=1 Tax=Trichoderma lentiforme TaxID=1567552 RepID=A0A9P4X9W8_9HYPO|nr:Conidial yellow pigment biosynthesis polyketide synthase [Trichoderma lentiforme]
MTAITKRHLLLFGDQTVEKLTSIQALVRNAKASPAAKRFLQEITDVIQVEFSTLSKSEHGWTGTFDTLLGLAEENDEQNGANALVATVLMCIGRLGELVVHAERDPTILGTPERPVEILGFCTGLLPAAVVVAAKDTSELHTLAREIVQVTFRMTREIVRQTKLVEDSSGDWARTYIGITREKMESILDDFHSSNSIPPTRQISVGVVSEKWTTIIGAPSSLTRLASWSSEIELASHAKTDIGALIHSNVLPPLDVEKILAPFSWRDRVLDWTKARLISPASCTDYTNSSLGSFIGQIINDIASNALLIDQTIHACISRLDKATTFSVTIPGPTGYLPAVEQAFRSFKVQYELNKQTTDATGSGRGGSDMIAIIGMSGRFPGTNSTEEFWDDVLAANCHIESVPKSRWDLDVFFDPEDKSTRKNATTAMHGAWLESPGLFDNRLFNMSPREASQTDPIHRLLLTTSYEALESAGYSPDGTISTESNRIASFLGQTTSDWQDVLNQDGIDIYYIPGVGRAFASGRVNHHFKWGGTSLSVDAACATGIATVSLAVSALLARECDMALAGGGAVHISPNTYSGLSKAGMVSTTGGCRTYHDDADGYVRGEAVGVVVLKRLEDAVAENDNILGVVRAAAQTYTSTSSSILHPSHVSQERIYKEVLHQSGLQPQDIDYVEMHGTGTQAGDVEEMTSVINVLSKNRTKNEPLTVGAVKAVVGHGEAAAGITSLIKSLMMLRDGLIPAQPGWPFKVNRNFPSLAKANVRIATKTMDLKPSSKADKKAKILINSFGASGSNTCVIVEEPPEIPEKQDDPRGFHVVTLSARSAFSLKKNRENLIDYLERKPETRLADLAYSTTARRMHETLRIAYVGNSVRDVVRQLRHDATNGGPNDPKAKTKKSPRLFLFTGQGSQYAGMGAELFAADKGFAELLGSYQDLATNLGLPKFVDIISDKEIDIATKSPAQVQLAVVALEIAIAHTLKKWGVFPDAVLGHSLGEYAALAVSGALSVADALYLVGKRALLMEKHLEPHTYAMLVTSLSAEDLQQRIAELKLESCGIACVNGPSVAVASGPVNDLKKLEQHLLDTSDTKSTFLKVPFGFHSAQVEPILEEFEKIANGVTFSNTHTTFVSSLTGTTESSVSPAYLSRQTRESVQFTKALEACEAAGLIGGNSLTMEIGPDPVCLSLVRRTLNIPTSARLIPSLKSGQDNWSTISTALKAAYETGVNVNWPEFHKGFKNSVRLLDLPTYAFEYKDFWTPYQELEPVQTTTPPPVVEKVQPPKYPGFVSTSSLQRIESETIQGSKITVVYSSETSEPALLQAIQGHSVVGRTICPMVVYCDMAIAATKYAHWRLHDTKKAPDMSIYDMDMARALVIEEGGSRPAIHIRNFYDRDQGFARVTFYSITPEGREIAYGACKVKVAKGVAQKNSPQQLDFLLRSRMVTLQEQSKNRKAHAFLKPVVYRLFANVVGYGEAYQGLEEVVVDTRGSDGMGTVRLPQSDSAGHFTLDPFLNDAAIHLCGFLVNSGLNYPEDDVFICPGFQSWRFLETLHPGKVYSTYVYMQESASNDGSLLGNCYVLDGDRIVQELVGIKFQKMKRAVLQLSLTSTGEQPKNPPAETHRPKPPIPQQLPSIETTTISATEPQVSDDSVSAGTNTPEASDSEIIDTLLAIVAREIGVNVDEMLDETAFIDLGVDSLVAVTIFTTLEREVGLKLQASFFVEHTTVGDVKRALHEML